MTQELSDFALGFVKGCANKNMTVDQMLKAAMHASDNIPGIKSELQPLLTMDKEAGKWNPKNVWGGAKKVWKGVQDIPGWFASKFNKNISDVPTPAPPARDPTFSAPTPASPPRDLTFSDVPEPPEHLQEMLRIPNPSPPPSPGVPNPVPPPKGNMYINRQALNTPRPTQGDELDDLIRQINELGRPPGKQIPHDVPLDMHNAGLGPPLTTQQRLGLGYEWDGPLPPNPDVPSQHVPRNIFLQPGSGMEDATRADQWDFLRNNPDLGKGVPLEIDFQDYYKGRENWHLDHYDRGAKQVQALQSEGNQLTTDDFTPRQWAMLKQLHREHARPLDVLRQQWDDAAASAVGSGRSIDPGDVPPEVAEHMYYRNADNRARQAGLQTDYDAVYEQLKITNPAEAEAFRKMQNMMKKLKEMGAGQPAPGDLLIPPPSSHPQVQVPPYRGKQGMASVKLALDMFRDGRSLNAQQ